MFDNVDNSAGSEEQLSEDDDLDSLKEEISRDPIDSEEQLSEDNDVDSLKEEITRVKTELKVTKQQSEATLNKLKYLMADYDNYRKQIEKQVHSSMEANKAEIISKFLDIHDDYQRALGTVKKKGDKDKTLLEGLEGILKNFDNILQSQGISTIETTGMIFDPHKHDVISFSYNDDLPENSITEEVRVGYMLNDKVLRPSLVIISKKYDKNNIRVSD